MEQGSSSSDCFSAFFSLFIKLDSTNIKACSESKAIKWCLNHSQFKTDIICIHDLHTHMTFLVLKGLLGSEVDFWGFKGTFEVLGGLLRSR